MTFMVTFVDVEGQGSAFSSSPFSSKPENRMPGDFGIAVDCFLSMVDEMA